MTEFAYVVPNLDPEDDTLASMLRDLDRLKVEKDANEEQQKAIKEKLRDALGSNGLNEFETATHKFSMTYPEDRTTINKEKLLLAGVPIAKILDATDRTAVAPYINVRRKKEAKS